MEETVVLHVQYSTYLNMSALIEDNRLNIMIDDVVVSLLLLLRLQTNISNVLITDEIAEMKMCYQLVGLNR